MGRLVLVPLSSQGSFTSIASPDEIIHLLRVRRSKWGFSCTGAVEGSHPCSSWVWGDREASIPRVCGEGALRSCALAQRACSLAWEYKAYVLLTWREKLSLSEARGLGLLIVWISCELVLLSLPLVLPPHQCFLRFKQRLEIQRTKDRTVRVSLELPDHTVYMYINTHDRNDE